MAFNWLLVFWLLSCIVLGNGQTIIGNPQLLDVNSISGEILKVVAYANPSSSPCTTINMALLVKYPNGTTCFILNRITNTSLSTIISNCPASIQGATDMTCSGNGGTGTSSMCFLVNPVTNYVALINYANGVVTTRVQPLAAGMDPVAAAAYDNVYVALSNNSIFLYTMGAGPVGALALKGTYHASSPIQNLFVTATSPSNQDYAFVSYKNDPNLYTLTLPRNSVQFNQTLVYNSLASPFEEISLAIIDPTNRIIVYDPVCHCIKVMNSARNGTVEAIVNLEAGSIPKSIAAHKGKMYVVDNFGIKMYTYSMSVSIEVQNINCRSRGGSFKTTITGGTSPYTVKINPDRISATVNSDTYVTNRSFTANTFIHAPGNMVLYNSTINPGFTLGSWDFYSQARVVTAAQMPNGYVPYTGQSCVEVNCNTTPSSTACKAVFTCGSTDPKNCLQIHKYNQLHMYILSDKTHEISLSLDSGSASLAINTRTDPRVINNTWSKLEFNLSSFTNLDANSISIYHSARGLQRSQSILYIDNIHLSPYPADIPRTFTISDACGESTTIDAHIHEENVFDVSLEVTPVTCHKVGLANTEKSSDGIIVANVVNGQQPFIYNWVFANGSSDRVVNLPSLRTSITVYDNALNSSFQDASGNFERDYNDSNTFYSAPSGFNFAPQFRDVSLTFVSPVEMRISEFPVIELMVNGGEFGGQRINLVVSWYAREVESVHLESIMEANVISPGIWRKARLVLPANSSTPVYDRISLVSYGDDPQPRIYFDDLYILSPPVLTVTDNTGCSVDVDDVVVPTPPSMQYTKSFQNLKCNGVSEGALVIHVAGGTPNYTVSLTSANVNENYIRPILNLPQSKLIVNITDFAGCQAPLFDVEILQPPALSIDLDVQPIQCFGGSSTLTAIVTGGVPPYTYSWFSPSLTTTPQPIPEMWFSDDFSIDSSVSASGLLRVCDGTGVNTGISANGGYCMLALNSSSARISCSEPDCLDTETFASISFYMYASDASDIEGMQIILTKSEQLLSSWPLSSLASFTSGQWTKVTFNIAQSNRQPDGFNITSANPAKGNIVFDDIVAMPLASGGAGVSVYAGFRSIVSGPSNSYFLSVVDSNGCKVERVMNVAQPAPLAFSYVVTNASSQTSNDGSISVTVSGGNPPYTYLWIGQDETSNVLSNVSYNSYTIRVTDSNGCTNETSIILLSDPYTPEVKEIVYRKYDKSLAGGMGAVVGAGILVGIFALVMFAMFFSAFSRLGSFFSGVLLLGVFVSYAGAIMLLPEPTDNLCMAYPWLMGIAFVLVYGCLFIKTWTIYRVWSKAKEYQRANLTPFYILRMVIAALLIEIIFLIIWTVVEPIEAKWVEVQRGDLQLQCTSESNVFWIIFLAAKGAWLLVGAVLSVLSRDIVKKYNESSSIGYAIYNNIVLLTIGIPLGVLLGEVAGGRLVIMIIIPVIAFTFTLCIMFARHWFESIMPSAPITQPKSPKGSARTTTGSDTHSSGAGSGSGSGNTPSPPPSPAPTKTIELTVI